MDRIFIFDVDGTLTPSRQRMTEEFAKFFDEWSSKNKYYLVTGSDLDKTKEQLPIAYIDRAESIFTCCGNEMWRDGELVYDNKFNPPQDLLNYLQKLIDSEFNYPIRTGNHIEDRKAMLNFSIVGRKCTLQERKDYFEYDELTDERKEIAKYIKKHWVDLDAVIGGQISIDIYPKGNDKSQVLDIIEQERLVNPDKIIFIGDGINNKGNDYALAKLMNKIPHCKWYDTDGWKHTQQILEKLSD